MELQPDFWREHGGFGAIQPRERFQNKMLKQLEKSYGVLLPPLLADLFRQKQGRSSDYPYFPFFDQAGHLFNYLEFELANLSDVKMNTDCCITVWRMPAGIIAINRFEGHFCFALDYRDLNPKVEAGMVYIHQIIPEQAYGLPVETTDEGLNIIRLSPSFDAFLEKLINQEELEVLARKSPHDIYTS